MILKKLSFRGRKATQGCFKALKKEWSCLKLSSHTFSGGDGDHGICHFLRTLNKKGHNLVTWLSEVLFAKPQGNRYYAGN